MRYMIAVKKAEILSEGSECLIAYTGIIHETKQEALAEYIEASDDPDVYGVPFIVLV